MTTLAPTGCGMHYKPNLPDDPCRQTANDHTLFWTLKVLQETWRDATHIGQKNWYQRQYHQRMLKALVEKGCIEMGNFSKNTYKLSYAYPLTPTGVAQKSALIRRLLQRKMAEYGNLRVEIGALHIEAATPITRKREPKE